MKMFHLKKANIMPSKLRKSEAFGGGGGREVLELDDKTDLNFLYLGTVVSLQSNFEAKVSAAKQINSNDCVLMSWQSINRSKITTAK